MEFGPSKAQELLRSSTGELLQKHASVERVREIMATDSAVDPVLAEALAEQGVLGLLIEEEFGGAGLGLFEVALLAQELGRHVAPFDFLGCSVLAPLLIDFAGSDTQKATWLPKIVSGEETFAVVRGVRERQGRLEGVASLVPGVAQASRLLVEVGGRCFIVPVTTSGVTVEHLRTIDETRRWSEVNLDGVAVSSGEALARRVPGEELLRVLEAGQVTVAADSLGACYRAIELAVEYAKSREQFGRVIGSFQAVKHLCAEMIASVDPLQSLLWYAAYSWDQREDVSHHVIPLCKAHAGDVGSDCVSKATQVLGGIGFTWECDMHLFFKRVQVDRQLLGRPEEHREQAAVVQLS